MLGGARLRDRAAAPTRALAALSARGRLGAELGWRLDLARAAGPTTARRRSGPWWHGSDLEAVWNSFYAGIWEDAARWVTASLDDLGSGFLVLRRGDRRTTVWRFHVMLDDPVTLGLALDKGICAQALSVAGLPVAQSLSFDADDIRTARRFLADRRGPCVVKPASGTGGGKGVTCGVAHGDDLVRACLWARRWDRTLMIEHQTAGSEYRLLFLDGELLDVVRRRPPVLVGDGRTSVGGLIRAENSRRVSARGRAGLRRIDVDLDCLLALRASGHSVRSVLSDGEQVMVKSTVNVGGPSDNETMNNVGPELVADAARAVSILGVRLAGVDLITPDPTLSLGDAGGVIVEVNGTPGLHYHYLVATREMATPVARPILDHLLMVEHTRFASTRRLTSSRR